MTIEQAVKNFYHYNHIHSDNLSDYFDSYMKEGEKSYCFGFRQCKQLISFYYNTPNNTLCTFWKVTDTHMPLFRRQKQGCPNIGDLKAVKKVKDDRAYYSKKEMRGQRSDGHIG